MKNLLKIVLPVLLFCFILSSCKNGSVMKRKYNRGYYVSHRHHTGNVKGQPALTTTNKPAEEIPHVEYVKPIAQDLANTEPENNIVINTIEKPAVKTEQTEKVKRNSPQFAIDKLSKFSPLKPNAVQLSNGPDAGVVGAALSLFWIVILVILLLYLIGLAADGFGLGWAIHILAVVILVLLILWLLRLV